MADNIFQKRVLIVDGSVWAQSMLRETLRQLGFKNILEAEDGERALSMISAGSIDLVFTDLNMPALSGIELIQKIRQNAASKYLPVIVVSGESDQDVVIQALRAGANAFVVKPFSSKTIKERIIQVLSKVPRPTP